MSRFTAQSLAESPAQGDLDFWRLQGALSRGGAA